VKTPPRDSAFLNGLVRVPRQGGPQRWRSVDGQRIYEWDSLHGELEVYTRRGYHLGALDPHSGAMIKDARRGRRIDV
jgi:Cytotoxic